LLHKKDDPMHTHKAALPQEIVQARTDHKPIDEDVTEPQHTLLHSAIAHLGPGVLITIFYLLTAPALMRRGLPPIFALLLAILFVALPVELGDLIRRGRKHNGRLSLRGVVLYREPLPWWQYPLFVIAFLIAALLLSGAAGFVDVAATSGLARILPPWFFLQDLTQYAAYSRTVLIGTLIASLVLNGVVGPVVEELYFRGYLLPRLSRFGAWAPLINAALFTIYHFWQPYAYVSVFAVAVPWVYLVWWKRNVYLGIAMHCALNLISNTLLFAALLSRA
jgi:uncharacterized protein